MTTISYSDQQSTALRSISSWLKDKNGPQIFRLFGYAGTGKTTIAKEVAGFVKGGVRYAAFTGKAALMLRRKGCDDASTIHGLIYKLDEETGGKPQFRLNRESPLKNADLAIIDECSMVDQELAFDLLSFGKKILVLGDPAQLPPVKGAGFFINAKPDVMLTEVHRQAANNPIIHLSMAVRNGEKIRHGQYGDCRVISSSDLNTEDVLGADQVLAGLNKTRRQYNRRFRALKDFPEDGPVVGDRLVCLKNNHESGLLNGGLWNVKKVYSQDPEQIKLLIDPDHDPDGDKDRLITTHKAFFDGTESELTWEQRRWYDEFDYGYVLTVHKAQGSEWDDVVLFDESTAFRMDRAKWLYTGITRAAKRVTIVQH